MDEFLFETGRSVRGKRQSLGLTQQALARRADLPLGTVQRIEAGRGCQLRTLRRLALALEQIEHQGLEAAEDT